MAALVILSPQSFAQASPAKATKPAPGSSFTLTAIKVTGSIRYTQEEIIAASGLQVGNAVSEEDFKLASQRLGESGAFGDVGYRFQYSPSGATLDLQLTDNTEFVPVRFDNLVWFSDQELADKLRERVPLYRGQLPLNGEMADQVSDALQALLIERQIPGRADYLRSGALNGPIEAFVFSVSGPNIRIRNIAFEEAAPAEAGLLKTAADKLKGSEYTRSLLEAQARMNFRPIYLERGYLKAAFSEAQAKVAQQDADKILVDVALTVNPGHQYNFTTLEWSGLSVFSAEQLEQLLHLERGKPANAIQLGTDLTAVQKVYGTRGYMATHITPVPQMDDESRTVSWQLQVQEGDVYRMGELEIRGVDNPTARRLVLAWKLKQGDTYDSSYAERFMKEAANSIVKPSEWDVSVHESADAEEKTVDVTLRLERKATR
jgi:outer membrane protein insertion porin family